MTQEQELQIVELCKQFMKVAEEINLTFFDLCKIRDKYFPIINGRSVQNPADLAKSIRVLEDHCKEMKAVLSQSMGVKDEAELVKGNRSDAKIHAATSISVSSAIDYGALEMFVKDYDVHGKTKNKAWKLIAAVRDGGKLANKDRKYIEQNIKGQPIATFLGLIAPQ